MTLKTCVLFSYGCPKQTCRHLIFCSLSTSLLYPLYLPCTLRSFVVLVLVGVPPLWPGAKITKGLGWLTPFVGVCDAHKLRIKFANSDSSRTLYRAFFEGVEDPLLKSLPFLFPLSTLHPAWFLPHAKSYAKKAEGSRLRMCTTEREKGGVRARYENEISSTSCIVERYTLVG